MKFKITRLKCSKCGHVWIPYQENIYHCPKCKIPLEKLPPKILNSTNNYQRKR